MPTWPVTPNIRVPSAVGRVSRWLRSRGDRSHSGSGVATAGASVQAGPSVSPETVIILTTWNRPALLRQSLPQIEREAASIGAHLVISDDQSDDPETLALLEGAGRRGASVIRREFTRTRQPDVDVYLHNSPEFALEHMQQVHGGFQQLGGHAATGSADRETPAGLFQLWQDAVQTAHECTQHNNLFAFRHVIATYPTADWILKVDDDVAMREGAFASLHEAHRQAVRDGLDVVCVSGIRTTNEEIVEQRARYAITRGACNVAILYRKADWIRLLEEIPESLILRDGFDLAFMWQYASRHRAGAVAISLTPSVVYHTGFNGVHVRNVDLNSDYAGSLEDVTIQ